MVLGVTGDFKRLESLSSTFKHPDGELTMKSRDFMNSDLYQPQPLQQQQSFGLMRYRSAPSSFFASLVDGGGNGCKEFLNPHQSSSPESEAMFASFMSSNGSGGGCGGDDSDSHDLQFPTAMRFGIMRDVGNFRISNGTKGKASPTSRLNDHMNFSSGPSSCSRFMPQITENGNESESIEASSPENGQLGNNNNSGNRFFVPSFQNDSLNGSGFTGLIKRNRDGDEVKFSGFNALESQNGDSRNYTTGLTHHLSLPKTSAEMAAIEKFLQFQQDSVPCKIRAKRGFATHPRSIAERARRTRISERMRKLQELFPNMDKVAHLLWCGRFICPSAVTVAYCGRNLTMECIGGTEGRKNLWTERSLTAF